jgi:ankyrin repeat protein
MDRASRTRELADAVYAGNLLAVEALIAAGVDVNAVADGLFSPPLHDAIEHHRVEIARRLIAAGADVNHDIGDGQTALFHAIDCESDWASQRGIPKDEASTELTEMLLAAGGVPTPRAFELARAYNNRRVLSLLELAKQAVPGTSPVADGG